MATQRLFCQKYGVIFTVCFIFRFDFKADAKILDLVDKAKKKFAVRSTQVQNCERALG